VQKISEPWRIENQNVYQKDCRQRHEKYDQIYGQNGERYEYAFGHAHGFLLIVEMNKGAAAPQLVFMLALDC
jgi:hypothetical protein